jgi:hypothetical protein
MHPRQREMRRFGAKLEQPSRVLLGSVRGHTMTSAQIAQLQNRLTEVFE